MLWGKNSEWISKSSSEAVAGENHGPDLLDEHLGLVDRAVRERVIALCHQGM